MPFFSQVCSCVFVATFSPKKGPKSSAEAKKEASLNAERPYNFLEPMSLSSILVVELSKTRFFFQSKQGHLGARFI